jgi:hypothetical protein
VGDGRLAGGLREASRELDDYWLRESRLKDGWGWPSWLPHKFKNDFF